jgi:large subunit ribosomal protein L6
MSRVGKLPVTIPEKVEVLVDGSVVKVSGPNGNLELKLPREIEVQIIKDSVLITVKKKSKKAKALHGTVRAKLANMVYGVSEGWIKVLELVGTGYRAEVADSTLILTVGFSHPVKIKAPGGISFKVQKNDIEISGIDKELVGQTAATIRAVRPPEPYKGKGIRYKDEVVKTKPGKAAKAQGAAA